MTELHTDKELLPHIPNNLTIAQFMLDYQHDIRPIRSSHIPCLIDDISGRSVSFESVSEYDVVLFRRLNH